MAKKITSMRANENSNNKARENAGDQVVVGFSFESDWLRKRRKFSGQITELNKTKVKKSRIIFDTQLKISLRNVLGFPQSRLP